MFGILLVLITVIDGFKIADSPLFIVFELILNMMVSVDLGLRVKLYGFKNYVRQNRLWNKLDVVIVVGCNVLFLVSLINNISLGEVSDELLLVFWLIGQSLRMIVIARKQKKAIDAAKILIDLTNI